MSDAEGGSGAGHGEGAPGPEPVGSVGEEAAKLFGVLSDWAQDQGSDYAGSAGQAAGAMADAVRGVGEHVATGGEDCRFCPVCQVIHAVRHTSPEVRSHLTQAATSLVQAAASLLATQAGKPQQSPPVEKIDLDSGTDWDEQP